MTKVELKHISNEYILHDVNLTIQDGQILSLLGPTGAGKTTLLNVIAGIIDYEGSVLFDGESVDNKPASKRDVGYVFQNLALFPHLDVASNIAYGMKVRKRPSSEIYEKVNELLKLMKIEHLRKRYPKDLSGGEKQRVALARALAISPRVLLLDEPLNNLDNLTRKYLRDEIRRIQTELKITTVFVTHDIEEAKEISDKVAIIFNGKVHQIGSSEEVFFNPLDDKVADLIGSQNILTCSSYKQIGEELYEVDCNGIKIVVLCEESTINKIVIPAKDIQIYASEPTGSRINVYKGVILGITPISSSLIKMRIRVGENVLVAELPKEIFSILNLTVGKEVFLKLKLMSIRAYP